ncbi:MAG: hypothetical protein FJ026_00115, partial [Chloroflexi bacterium]|nr:hypothetical protein [Chloroflexota bacterium]
MNGWRSPILTYAGKTVQNPGSITISPYKTRTTWSSTDDRDQAPAALGREIEVLRSLAPSAALRGRSADSRKSTVRRLSRLARPRPLRVLPLKVLPLKVLRDEARDEARAEAATGLGRRGWIEARFSWILLVVGLALLLGNLGNMYLWQDEAETALLSQRLGAYGLPMAFDGRNLIRQAPQDVQYTDDYVWVYHPWLPFYFTTLSFSLLGETTFAARLPYALAGLATILLFYHSTRRHFRDPRVAMLGATFLLLCVPFLLHSRQCKYFPFAALFTVATLDAYLCLCQEQRTGVRTTNDWRTGVRTTNDWPTGGCTTNGWRAGLALPYFILAGFGLFQSNFGAFLPLMVALVLHFFLSLPLKEAFRLLPVVPGALRSRPRRADFGRLALAMGILAVFVLPWAIYLQTWARGRFVFDVYRFAGHLVHYVVYITGWIFPVILVVLFAYFYLSKQRGFCLEDSQVFIVNLYALVIALTLLFLSATFIWMYFSYIVQLVPLLMLLLALTVIKVLDHSQPVGYTLILLLVATNLLHVFPYVFPVTRQFKWASLAPRRYLAETDELIATAGVVRFDLVSYGYELTHDYDDPNEGIALFLQDR